MIFDRVHAIMQLMEWENWQCALLVAQLGTVAAAASRLNVDATTVSRRVKRLEAKLGARIFERRGLRLHATYSFREALTNVEAADVSLRSAEEAVGHPSGIPTRSGLRCRSWWIICRAWPLFVGKPDSDRTGRG